MPGEYFAYKEKLNLLCKARGTKKKRLYTVQLLCFLFSLVLLLMAYDVSALQDDDTTQLSAGVARKNITPDVNVKNWVTGKPYGSIEDSIYVRALVLNDGRNTVVMIAWDLVDAGESATHEVRKRISSEMKIPIDHILVNAAHNHSAPWSPVYQPGYRGKELDTWWAIRYMPAQNNDPFFKEWMDRLINQTVSAAKEAYHSMQPVDLWLGRVNASAYMINRRPRFPKWGLEESNIPKGYNFASPEYNPDVLVGGATFGPMDRTMTLLSFRTRDNKTVASVFHLAVHAVSIYPFSDAISGDWPEETSKQISKVIGGEAIFFQGNAGDINPWRRGRAAVDEMAAGLTALASTAYRYSAKLLPASLKSMRTTVGLPLSDRGRERTGLDTVKAEVQVITYGSLAFVTLPGEPLTGLGNAIRAQSPFPQTLVLGYANGNGVHYVALPDEKPHGGYEVETGTSGTEYAGKVLEEAAVQLLRKAMVQLQH